MARFGRRNRPVGAQPTLLMSMMSQSPFQSRRFHRKYDRLQKSAGVTEAPGSTNVDTSQDLTIADPMSHVYQDDTVVGSKSPWEASPLADRAERAAQYESVVAGPGPRNRSRPGDMPTEEGKTRLKILEELFPNALRRAREEDRTLGFWR